MTKINNSIKELYPNGFEYRTLDNLVSIVTGKLNANKMVENGQYAFFTCDAIPFRIDTYAFDGEAILISGNGSQVGHLNYYVGKFNAYQRTYVLMDFNKDIIPKYLFHYLNTHLKKHINENSKKGSVPYITLPMLQKFKVAIPPIDIQKEIIQKLENFSKLESELIIELKEELKIRKNQYDFFHKQLLKSDEEKLKLKDITSVITKGTTPTSIGFNFEQNGEINFVKIESINNGVFNKDKLEHISLKCNDKLERSKLKENDILFSIAGAIGKTVVVSNDILPANTNQALAIIRLKNENFNVKYINHYLNSIYIKNQYLGKQKGSAQTNVSLNDISNFEIPNISINEQNRIVDIFDNFDKLINELSENLFAEIELRGQQYEYYRNKLLSFEELSVSE